MSDWPRREYNRDVFDEGLRTSHTTPDEQFTPGSSEGDENTALHDWPSSPPDPSNVRVVLIAEDEEPIAEAIALLLEDEGYRPFWVTNGKEALEAARSRWPDLVLTDLMMPRMSGTELIAALRARAVAESRPMPPVVMMTAGTSPGQRRMAELKEAGIDAVVTKPFDINTLIMLVTRLMGQR